MSWFEIFSRPFFLVLSTYTIFAHGLCIVSKMATFLKSKGVKLLVIHNGAKSPVLLLSNMDRQLLHQISVRQPPLWKQKHWCFQRNDISKIITFDILIHILPRNIYFRLLIKGNKLKINNCLTNLWQTFDIIIDNP